VPVLSACLFGRRTEGSASADFGLLSLVFFASSYTWIMWPHPVNQRVQARTRSRLSFLLFVVLSLQVTVFSLVDGPAWLWLFIGVGAIAGVLLPMRKREHRCGALLRLLPLFITISTHGGGWGGSIGGWLIALMLLVRGLGLDMIGIRPMGSAILGTAYRTTRTGPLAGGEERLRMLATCLICWAYPLADHALKVN